MGDQKLSELSDGSPLQSTDLIYAVRPLGTSPESYQSYQVSAQAIIDYANDAANLFSMTTQSGSTYTLALTDKNTLIDLTNASSVTLTVPTNASVAFDVGTQIKLRQGSTGQITLSAAVGVTINSKYGRLKSENAQYAEIYLHKIATDTWQASGDLSA